MEESEEVVGSIEDVEDDQRGIYWISRMKNASNQGMGKKKQVNDTGRWQRPSNRLLPALSFTFLCRSSNLVVKRV